MKITSALIAIVVGLVLANPLGIDTTLAKSRPVRIATETFLLFDELDKFGVWDIIEAAPDVVFAAWKVVSVDVTDDSLYRPICG
jgi:hypothetical protein